MTPKGPHTCDCLCEKCEQRGEGAFGPQPDGSRGVVVIAKRPLRPGTAVCWTATKREGSLRGRIVTAVKAGTPPAEAAPELTSVKSTQLKFGGLGKPRCQDHYLIRREVRTGRGMDLDVYYLPTVQAVQSVRDRA